LNQPTSGTIAGFAYLLGTIFFTVYGQLVLKWQVSKAGALPASFSEKMPFLISLLLSPWMWSGMASGFLAFLCWMATMTKFQLSYAYPFMSLSFLLVLMLSVALFREPLTLPKILGMLLIMAGIIVTSQG
jgi:multidrug transporter EmrE-like cation transporter